MTKWIAVAFVLAFATPAHAMTPLPVHQPDGAVTQVRLACGPGRTRVGGVCVARTTIRHTRRTVRRCARWHEAPAFGGTEFPTGGLGYARQRGQKASRDFRVAAAPLALAE